MKSGMNQEKRKLRSENLFLERVQKVQNCSRTGIIFKFGIGKYIERLNRTSSAFL